MSENFSFFKRNILEDIKVKVAKDIEEGIQNSISEQEYNIFSSVLKNHGDFFAENSYLMEAMKEEENMIKEFISKASAKADTLTEYHEVLKQVEYKFELGKGWAEKVLAHENAHSNVAEATKHPILEYGVLFINDGKNSLLTLQPYCYTDSDITWDPIEKAQKIIKVLRAPRAYGEELSPDDMKGVELEKIRLKKSLIKRAQKDI